VKADGSEGIVRANLEQIQVRNHRLKLEKEKTMTGTSRVQTVFMVWLCAILIVVQSGCAMHRTPAQPILQLGKVGVVSAQYTPAFEFALPAKGWLGGAGRGAVGGTKAFIVLVPSAAVIAGVSFGAVCCTFGALVGHGLVGALWAAGALVKGAGYLIVGPFYGAAKAEAPATVEEAEVHLKTALTSMRIQETMRDHVVQAAQSLTNANLTVLDGQGPEIPSDLLTYFPIQDATIDTVLELRVTRVWLSTNQSFFKPVTSMLPSEKPTNKPSQEPSVKSSQESWHPINPSQELQINPLLSLGMEVRGRLIRNADKVVLYDNTWQHEGEAHVFAEWAANDAKLFGEEFEHTYDVLSNQIVPTIF